MRTFLLISITTFLFVFLSGCGTDDKNTISQKWRLAEITSPKIQANLEKMGDKEKETFTKAQEQIKEKTSFEFQKNGKYEFIFLIRGEEQKSKGTWELVDDEEGQFLKTKEDSTNREQRLKIEKLNKEEFVLKELNSDSTLLKLIPAN